MFFSFKDHDFQSDHFSKHRLITVYHLKGSVISPITDVIEGVRKCGYLNFALKVLSGDFSLRSGD